MKIRILPGLVIAMLYASYINTAMADNIAPLRIGIMALKPYGFYDDAQQPRGSLFEIGEAILRESGLKGHVSIQPIKRMFRNINETDTIDCTLTAILPSFRKTYRLIEPIGWSLEFGILPVKGLSLEKYSNLKKIRIAVARGISTSERFDSDQGLNKVQVTNYESAMYMLDRNRVDAAAGVISSLLFSAKQSGIDHTGFGKPLILRQSDVWLYCARNSPILEHDTLLRETMVRLRKSGFVAEVIARY